VEILGSYNPHRKSESLKPERIKYWVEKGVKFSNTAFNFLVSKGLIAGPKRTVKFPKKPEAPIEAAKPAEPKVEAKKEEAIKPARNANDSVAGGEENKEAVIPEEKKPEAKEAVVDKEKKEA